MGKRTPVIPFEDRTEGPLLTKTEELHSGLSWEEKCELMIRRARRRAVLCQKKVDFWDKEIVRLEAEIQECERQLRRPG